MHTHIPIILTQERAIIQANIHTYRQADSDTSPVRQKKRQT